MVDSREGTSVSARNFGRRAFVERGLTLGFSASAVTAVLAACGGSTSAPTTGAVPTGTVGDAASSVAPSASAPSAVPATAQSTATRAAATRSATAGGAAVASPGGANSPITILDTGAKLPTGTTTLRWLDGSASPRSTFQQAFFPAYQRAHANITIAYEQATNADINKIVGLGVQNSNAHDCFLQPSSVTPGQMVREGWVRPLDEIIPNYDQWKTRFPAGVLVEGITMFGGKTYCCPYLSNKQHSGLILFNVPYLQQAGVDPASKPLTWNDFRAATKKVTEQGKGKYYGLIIGGQQTDQLEGFISILSQLAGVSGGPTNAGGFIDWKTGQYNYTSDQMLAAIDLLLAMKADGSVFPGSLSLGGPQARDQFSQGVAGIILQGAFNIPQWQKDVPLFNFGVGSPPVPSGGARGTISYDPGAATTVWVYAKSKVPEIAGDIFANFTSLENQRALVALTGGFPPPLLLKASELIALGSREQQTYKLFDDQMRLAPTPVVRNPDVAQVYLEQKRPTPDFGQTIQGLYTGQLKDAKGAMKDLQDRSEAELQRAIKAAQGKGAKVSRDDWKFANWDPTKDYTDADYAALK